MSLRRHFLLPGLLAAGIALAASGAAVAGTGSATAVGGAPPPAAIGPDQCVGGPTQSRGPACGGEDYESGYTEEGSDEDWFPNSTCRQVRAYRQFKTWWGHVVWKYYQRVYWCWNGSVVTYLNRDRWPDTRCCLWQFFGHISSNCSEHCNERVGHSWENVQTVGSYRHCATWCTREINPGVSISVSGVGSWGYGTWGG
jgi:hypothetical protein